MNLENEIRALKSAQDVQRKMLAAVLAKLEADGGFNAINMIENLRNQMTGIVHNSGHSSEHMDELLFAEETYRAELDKLSLLVSGILFGNRN